MCLISEQRNDGVSLTTKAIQADIDKCHQDEGSIVLVLGGKIQKEQKYFLLKIVQSPRIFMIMVILLLLLVNGI